MIRLPILSVALLALSPLPAAAADYLSGSLGGFDFFDDDNSATQLGLEYRFSPIEYGIRPSAGISVTDEGSLYGYGGFNWDIPLIDNQLYVIPNVMMGLYRKGDGKDLGGAIEFRSGIEVAYQFPNEHRLGVALNHISNASIYDRNPGAETILVNYSLPMSRVW